MLKERVKSLALFLLFALSIYLMKELWASDLILMLKNDSQTHNTVQDTASIVIPNTITYSFGNGSNSAVFYDVHKSWGAILPDLQRALSQPFKVEVVDESVFREAVSGRSIRYSFPYQLKVRDLIEVLKIDVNRKPTDNHMFQDLVIAGGKSKSILTRAEDVYLKITFDTFLSAVDLELLEAEKAEPVPFRTVESIYKIQSLLASDENLYEANEQLVPVGRVASAENSSVITEYAIMDDGVLRQLVSQFFGTHIVKKLVDIDGSLVYLYGYGEKALKISANGEIEFTAKLQTTTLKSINLEEALQIALSFVDRFGGVPTGLVLRNYQVTQVNDTPTYTLDFDMVLSQQRVVGDSSTPGISITLVGDQITEYRRFVLLPTGEGETLGDNDTYQTIDRLINLNFSNTLSPNFLGDNPNLLVRPTELSSRDVLFHLLQHINDFEPVYFLNEASFSTLVPVWRIGFDQYIYYFDLNTGQIIKTERKVD